MSPRKRISGDIKEIMEMENKLSQYENEFVSLKAKETDLIN
jgi:hypothetical protein